MARLGPRFPPWYPAAGYCVPVYCAPRTRGGELGRRRRRLVRSGAARPGYRPRVWVVRVRPVSAAVTVVTATARVAGGRRGSGLGKRRGRCHRGERVSEFGGRLDRRSLPGRALQQRPGDHAVHGGRDVRGHLARRADHAVGDGGRGQPCRLLAWPVTSQRRVEQRGECGRVRDRRVVGGGASQAAACERRVDAHSGDLDAAAAGPAERVRGQPQVRLPEGVRAGDRTGRVGDQGARAGRVERAAGLEDVGERLAAHPLKHDVGLAAAVLDVEDLGHPRVGQPACRPGGGHDLRDSRETGRERQDGDGARERLVDGLPQGPAITGNHLVHEPVTSGEPCSWFRDVRAHTSASRAGPGSRPPSSPENPTIVPW